MVRFLMLDQLFVYGIPGLVSPRHVMTVVLWSSHTRHTASVGQGHQELHSPPPTDQHPWGEGTDWPDCGGGVIKKTF